MNTYNHRADIVRYVMGMDKTHLQYDDCDKHHQGNKRNTTKTLDTKISSTTIPKNPNKNKNEVWRNE